MMEEEQISIKNAETKLDKKRGRTPFAGEGKSTKARLWMPTICHAAIFRLQEELGLASRGEAIHWLIRQARPELLPTSQPLPLRYRKKGSVHNSGPRPACMSDPDGDKQTYNYPATASSQPAVRTPVRASVVQASTVFFDTPATLVTLMSYKAEKLIACAAAYGSQLVVFPEAFVGGYPRCVKFDSTAAAHSTETDYDLQKYHACAIDVPGPEVDRLAKIAGKYKVHLVLGVVERAGFCLYSTVLYFDSLGRHLGKHRKVMQMALERAVWYAGDKSSLPVYETSIGKIGGLICWDNKLPLLRTELYDKGVQMYCAPTADAGEIWKSSMTHIAIEGGCFVLSANQFCRRRDYPLPPGDSNADISLDSITCAGGSVIISPSGAILAGPNYQGECLISADLDLGEIAKAKMQFGGVENNVGRNNVGLAANKSDPIPFATEIKMEAP